jgi:sirohydrochlorin cobaltochelatase
VDELTSLPLVIAMAPHLGEETPEQNGIPPFSDGGEITVDGKRIRIRYTRPLEDDPRLTELVISKSMEFLGD